MRYRPTEAGRAALPDALPARGAALRRLAQALVDSGSLALPEARALHPKAAATLDDWAARGWVDVEEIGWADAPVPKAVDNLLAAGGRTVPPALTDQQAEALDAIRAAQGFAPFLLHGVTGSGKTEVYLHALASLLDARPEAQALVLVPEINLTPQFEAAFRARFAGRSPTMRSSRCTAGPPRASVRATGSPRIRAARGSCSARASRCSRRCRRSR